MQVETPLPENSLAYLMTMLDKRSERPTSRNDVTCHFAGGMTWYAHTMILNDIEAMSAEHMS